MEDSVPCTDSLPECCVLYTIARSLLILQYRAGNNPRMHRATMTKTSTMALPPHRSSTAIISPLVKEADRHTFKCYCMPATEPPMR
jgi:hypothetical protein